MNLQESIRRILREEDYSPAGKEITPNKIVVHKSNPMFRDKIMENGLKVRAGECYKIYVGYGVKCKPAIFATNSTNKRAWFDSTYDDDIWEINTEMIPDVKWFKDRHYESRSKHIVTFQDIPKEAITLKYEGSGSGDVGKWDKDSPNLYESIRRILREESDKVMNMQSKILSQFRKQDQMERNEYSKFVQSEFGGDYERGAKEYAKIKNRNSDDIFGDKKRIREFILINFDFNTFSSKDWENYWLLSQHSDNHPEFQKNALNNIKQNLGEDNEYYEYLHDRISCRESGTQIYGTQNICKKSKMNLQESSKRMMEKKNNMKIKSIKVIKGKNKWSESKTKLIHMVLDLGEFEQKPSNKIDGFYERIKKHLPSLKSHRCSIGKPGGFFQRIKEGTWMGHIIEHVALELQTLAGYDTGWGRTRGVKGQKGVYNVVFNFENEECGKLAAKEAFNVVNDIINDKDPQIDKVVKKLESKTLIESIRRILREELNKDILIDGLYDPIYEENGIVLFKEPKHLSVYSKFGIKKSNIKSGKEFNKKYVDFNNKKLHKVLYKDGITLGGNLGEGKYWCSTEYCLSVYLGETHQSKEYSKYVKEVVDFKLGDNLKILVKKYISDDLW